MRPPGARQRRALEGYDLAALDERGLRDRHEAGLHQTAEHVLERPAIDLAVGECLEVEPPGGLPVRPSQRRENTRHVDLLMRARAVKLPGDALLRRAYVTDPARLAAILLVAEVAHQVHHPTAPRPGEARHDLELGLFVLALGRVTGGPSGAALADLAVPGLERAAVDHQLLERLFKGLAGGAAAPFVDRVAGRGRPRELGVDRSERAGLGVIALKEEFVGLSIDVCVHQDRRRRRAVATGAADLLVISL